MSTGSRIGGWLRAHVGDAFLFALFFYVYLVTAKNLVGTNNFLEYALGADPPCYTQFLKQPPLTGWYMLFRHPLTGALCLTLGDLIAPLRSLLSDPIVFKLPFALVGAINVVLAYRVFRVIGAAFPLLFALAYGFSSSIWFFASHPESPGVTATCLTAYVLFALKYRDGPSLQRIVVLTGLLMLGVMNEVSFATVVLFPLLLWGKALLRDRAMAKAFVLHTAGAAVLTFVLMTAFCYGTQNMSVKKYWQTEFTTSHDRAFQHLGHGDTHAELMKVAALNLYFFSVAFPNDHTTKTYLQLGCYTGFFEPSLGEYFDTPWSSMFLVSWILFLALSAWRIVVRRDGVSLALAAFIVVRSILVYRYNPIESLVFAPILVLPMLAIVARELGQRKTRWDALFQVFVLAALIASNVGFFTRLGVKGGPLPLSGVVDLPKEWNLDHFQLALEPVQEMNPNKRRIIRLGVTGEAKVPEHDEWYAWDAAELPQQVYTLTIDNIGYTTRVDVDRSSPRMVHIVVPPPRRVTVSVVDDATGADVPDATVVFTSAGDIFGRTMCDATRDPVTGKHELLAPRGRVGLNVNAPGYGLKADFFPLGDEPVERTVRLKRK